MPGQDYSKWNKDELRKAEDTAKRFLEENSGQIADTMRAKIKCLEAMVCRLTQKKSSFDQRLDCFARIAEISRLIEEDAEGFFELASQPMIARILQNVKTRK